MQKGNYPLIKLIMVNGVSARQPIRTIEYRIYAYKYIHAYMLYKETKRQSEREIGKRRTEKER